MRYFLFFISFLVTVPLTGEMIGQVEYQLPNEGKNWKIANEHKGDDIIKSRTVIYIPENSSQENANESFAAHTNNLPSDPNDQASLEKPIQMQFPNQQVKVNVIEKTPESVLYEWTVSDTNQEKVHGWTSTFSNPQETTMLIYLTDQINKVDQLRPLWIETLKKAKIVKQDEKVPAKT